LLAPQSCEESAGELGVHSNSYNFLKTHRMDPNPVFSGSERKKSESVSTGTAAGCRGFTAVSEGVACGTFKRPRVRASGK
jgi:hypothetical protein